MASTARATRASTAHGRLRRRAQLLTDEVGKLSPSPLSDGSTRSPELRALPPAAPASFNIEAFVDRAVDLTKGWEKIAALIALITTNLSGNKSLGALMEIISKDRNPVQQPAASGGSQGGATFGGLNISDLMGMAESLLRTGQLPQGLQMPTPPGPDLAEAGPAVEGEVIEVEATVPSTAQPAPEVGDGAAEASTGDGPSGAVSEELPEFAEPDLSQA